MTTASGTPGLSGLLADAAAQWPDRPAVTSDGTTLSYRELAAAANRLAGWLHTLGLRRGDRLLAHLPNHVVVPALVYGAARIGVAFSLINEQVRGTHLDHILGDCEPALFISATGTARGTATTRRIPAVSSETLTRQAFTVSSPVDGLPPTPLAVDVACLIYTSGTTALPKAVVSTHHQAAFAVRAIQHVLAYQPGDVVYSPLPLSFDYGLYQLFLAASSGAHVWLGNAAEAGPPLLAALARSKATVLAAVPSIAQTLARLVRRSGGHVLRLRKLTSTGAAMPTETLATLREFLPGLRVQVMFGLTECKRATIMPEDGDLTRPGSSGRALPGTEVYACDENGGRLPPGELGEIVVRGPNVMAGYWRRPEDTALRFPCAEGLLPELRTGDYGWFDEEGYVYVTGRRDDLYKENGFRVSCAEVEVAALRVPGVESAAVLPPTTDQPARLFYAGALTPTEVLETIRGDLEDFKVPSLCFSVDELPLTANGKVDRKRLAAFTREVSRVAGR